MAADREARYEAPIRDTRQNEAVWERGRNQEEFAYGYGADAREDITERQRGKGPGEPSRDVIFLGLDAEATENDVSAFANQRTQAELCS